MNGWLREIRPYHCVRIAAAFAVLVGGVVVVGGWGLDVAALRSVLPGLATMKVNTAMGLAGAGAALWLLASQSAPGAGVRVGRVCALLALGVGLLTLMEYLFGWNFAIDQLLFSDPESTAAGAPPGRPAPNTALALLLLGIALLLIDHTTSRGRRPAEWLALAAGLISYVGLLGYSYGVSSLYAVELYSSMALHTALIAFVLAAGIFCARPAVGLMGVITADSVGGYVARRLIPAALVVPPLVAGLRLAGERAGYYGLEFGLALHTTANVVVFAVLVLLSAVSLHGVDVRRRRAEQALRGANEALEARVHERTAALQREVDERKRLEEQFRGLFESAPDGIVISDGEGVITLANGQAEALFGYTRAELIGQRIELLIPERFRGPHVGHRVGYVRAPRTRAMGAGLDLFARRKDGSEFPVGISLSTISTDAGLAVVSDIRDVTRDKQAEYELRANEERFRAVTDNANDAIVTADADGLIVYFNPAAERIFGYTADEVVQRPVTLLIPERYRDAHREGLQWYLQRGEGRIIGQTMELVGRRKGGDEVPLELSLASWKIGEAETFFTGMLRDIRDRKAAEREIEQLNENLLRRTVDLEAANKELEAFSYSVSHDLRAPLRALDGFSQALLEDYRDRLDEEGQDYLQRVRGAAQRMGSLIDDLLKLSRVARTELTRDHVDISAIAASIADALQRTEPQRSAEFVIAEGLVAQADERLLQVAIENLLNNAWKFTRPRSVARIEFGVTRRADETSYFVRDNGVGFDMEYSDKLFSAFQRLHDAREFPGTGIGLATVQRVIHKHGGRIWAEGEKDHGAVFRFTL